MLRRILIPLDPAPYASAAIEYGCYLSKLHGAEITGMVSLDIPGIEKSVGPAPIGTMYYAQKLEKMKEQNAKAHIQLLLDQFTRKCEAAGVAHREAESQGRPSDLIIEDALFYDLLIIGFRTYFHFETSDKPESVENILDHSITPLLMVPTRFTLGGERPKALVAYNGSLPAARALRRFVRLFKPTHFEINLWMSHKDKAVAYHYLDGAEGYLAAHGVSNVEKTWTPQDKIQAIKEKHLDWADLIVLGAHSKKGLVDFMVGSLSKYLIKTGKKPLLLGQ